MDTQQLLVQSMPSAKCVLNHRLVLEDTTLTVIAPWKDTFNGENPPQMAWKL